MTHSEVERSMIEKIAEEFSVEKDLVSKMYDSFKQEYTNLSEKKRIGEFTTVACMVLHAYQEKLREPFENMDA